MTEHRWDDPRDQLTERELEILSLMAEGLSNREIGTRLYLALETVRWYSKRIYSKLQVKNRTQAAGAARELGLLELAERSSVHTTLPGLPRHNLPAQLTTFVGRASELDDLSRLVIDKDTRLLTIQAPGGMGKSRLAMQIGKASITHFPDGVYFLPLENSNSEEAIVALMTDELGIQPAEALAPAEHLLDYLGDKRMLLVMDGFEQAPDGASLAAEMLQYAKSLKILATSRERLGLQGEVVYKLKGLDLPRTDQEDDILLSGSVKLFVQSARQVRPEISFTADDLAYVVEVCRLVEGMPLGILLAAAWMEVLSPQEMAAEIAANLDILHTENQDVPVRQRSLRAVFDYSMGMLGTKERELFANLSVFRGDFTRAAAEKIAGTGLEILARFVGKSLVEYDPVRERYRLHTLMRQYGAQLLEQIGRRIEINNRHQEYFAGLLANLLADLKGRNQASALDRFQAEWENVRFAWRWAITQKNPDFVAGSVESMYWLCSLCDRVPEGKGLFQLAREAFFDGSGKQPDPEMRRLVLRFDASGDDYREQLEQAIAQARREGDPSRLGFLLWAYGVNAYTEQEFERGIVSLKESLDIYRQVEDRFYETEILHLLWICNRFGGLMDEAEHYLRASLDLGRKMGNRFAMARALGSRGAFDFLTGSFQQARQATEEALHIRREMGDRGGEAMSLAMLAWLASIEGDLKQARSWVETSLKIASDVHNLNSKMTAINVLGWLACLENDFQEAYAFCSESHRHAPDPTITVSSELVLAYAQYGLERYRSSKAYLRKVATFSRAIRGDGLAMLCLPLAALHLGREGKNAQAVQLLAFLETFEPKKPGWFEHLDNVFEFHDVLKGRLDGEAYQSAWKQGQGQDLDELVQNLL